MGNQGNIIPSVYIPVKPYVKAFYLSRYGEEPIRFPKRDKISNLVSILLDKRPADAKDGIPDRVNSIEIQIPCNDFHDRNIFNHLSQRSKETVARRITNIFLNAFHEDMEELLLAGFTRGDALALFIEKNRLPDDETTRETLRKSIYRQKRLITVIPLRGYTKNNLPDSRRIFHNVSQPVT